MTNQEVFSEATSVYDNYVEVLETGSVEALQHYARDLSERIIPRGVETHEVIGIVLLLRDVLARSLFEKYREDFELLNRVLDAYEPAANRIANTVAVSFVEQRERVIRDQQDALLELSTPVLQVRERLLILPIIGVLDQDRAQQLTEQLLHGIRAHRAKLVVIDITGVPNMDEAVANSLVDTVTASRLMGADVIITGLSSEIAQTLVTIGVDLSKMHTVGDLQGGIEEAERQLGFRVSKVPDDRLTRATAPAHPCRPRSCRRDRTSSSRSTLLSTTTSSSGCSATSSSGWDATGHAGSSSTSRRWTSSTPSPRDTLADLAYMAQLRGARTVVVGIAPDVAMTLVRLGVRISADADRAGPRGGPGVAGGVTDPLERFRLDYAPLLLRHLAQRDESGLQAAYQLGRRAMQDSVGLLDVVRVHNDAVPRRPDHRPRPRRGPGAGARLDTLLIDLIASFEVAQRRFTDARRTPGGPTERW